MNVSSVINKRRYREQHKETLKQYAQQYYERKKEELSDKKKETLECPICKCEVRKYTMKRHENIKHQMNINGHYLIQYNHNNLNIPYPHPNQTLIKQLRRNI